MLAFGIVVSTVALIVSCAMVGFMLWFVKQSKDDKEFVAESQRFTVEMWNEVFTEFKGRLQAGVPIGVYMEKGHPVELNIGVDPANFSVLMAHAVQHFGEVAPLAPVPPPQTQQVVQAPAFPSDFAPQWAQPAAHVQLTPELQALLQAQQQAQARYFPPTVQPQDSIPQMQVQPQIPRGGRPVISSENSLLLHELPNPQAQPQSNNSYQPDHTQG